MRDISNEQIRHWAERLNRSDRKAFDDMFRVLYPRLVGYAYSIIQDREAADDVVQDTFVLLWQKRHEVDPDRSVVAYVYRAVRNRALNYLRDRREVMEPEDNILADETASADPYENDPNFDEKARKKIYDWINKLPDRQREAFELSRFDGLHHHEIARVMEVSQKTVNNHLTAALKQLRDWYETDKKESGYLRS